MDELRLQKSENVINPMMPGGRLLKVSSLFGDGTTLISYSTLFGAESDSLPDYILVDQTSKRSYLVKMVYAVSPITSENEYQKVQDVLPFTERSSIASISKEMWMSFNTVMPKENVIMVVASPYNREILMAQFVPQITCIRCCGCNGCADCPLKKNMQVYEENDTQTLIDLNSFCSFETFFGAIGIKTAAEAVADMKQSIINKGVVFPADTEDRVKRNVAVELINSGCPWICDTIALSKQDCEQITDRAIEHAVRIRFNQAEYEKIEQYAKKLVEAKQKEQIHMNDGRKEMKRHITGLMGELAVEKILKYHFIDWSIGESCHYNQPDINGYDVGVKTVEYGKFPVIFKQNGYSQIICIRKDMDVYILGLADKHLLDQYQSEQLICDPKLRARGTKTAFVGLEKLQKVDGISSLSAYRTESNRFRRTDTRKCIS
jgi:hypothetical protein